MNSGALITKTQERGGARICLYIPDSIYHDLVDEARRLTDTGDLGPYTKAAYNSYHDLKDLIVSILRRYQVTNGVDWIDTVSAEEEFK